MHSPSPHCQLTYRLLCPQVNAQLSSERSSVTQLVHQEFADRLAASEEENRQVKAELAELRARQQLELDEVHRRWAAGGSNG